MVNDRLWVIVEHFESFLDGFFIIIGSSTRKPPVQKSFDKFIFSAIEVEYGFEVHPSGHDLFPDVHVFLTSRETVKQVPTAVVVPFDFLLNEFDH